MSSDDNDKWEKARSLTEGPQAAPLPVLNTRWLWGVVVVVPMFLSAGVYWLHSVPAGQETKFQTTTVNLMLVDGADADVPVPVMPEAKAEFSEGIDEPLVDATYRAIPEEAKAASHPPAIEPQVEQEIAPTAAPSIPRQTAAGASSSVFRQKLLSHIARYRRHPGTIVSKQRQVVQVMFAMRRDGAVSKIWVRQSAGYAALDQAAMETVRQSQPLPQIPNDLPGELTVMIPIAFDPN
ncbi:energy transducer TonB [Aliirhizobium terrae]|uniref:energy transducer TonB family protein n=1 Tax=Terrirhizobium terrae TaxID=2926709 RepID=UPI002575B85E|nr:energy transducer TonB [Rhizobium sp. CC-CFT758]WJH41197.1 energy transducer TonB [Rhizobium sp. CC-CFT758]